MGFGWYLDGPSKTFFIQIGFGWDLDRIWINLGLTDVNPPCIGGAKFSYLRGLNKSLNKGLK